MIYSQIGMRKSENENNPWMAFRDIAPQNSENFGIFRTRTEQSQVLKLPNKLTILFQIYSFPTKSNFTVKEFFPKISKNLSFLIKIFKNLSYSFL